MRQFTRLLLLCGLVLTGGAAFADRAEPPPPGLAVATFAGGCFWCVEAAFDKVEGVESTISGYTGGSEADPTYEQVSAGETEHAEAVRVIYDPDVVSYQELLDTFWHNIDPTVRDRQFCDVGSQYRSAIFYHNDQQKRLARETARAIEASGQLPGPVVTEIVPAGAFYPAEDYHQDYHNKNPIRYKWYTSGCGRADRLEELWGEAAG